MILVCVQKVAALYTVIQGSIVAIRWWPSLSGLVQWRRRGATNSPHAARHYRCPV